MNDRESALKWWRGIDYEDQIWLLMKCGYEKRYPESVTGREVESIWMAEMALK